jgi:large subunit ribosomal protein L6
MSRLGKKPLSVPDGVKIAVDGAKVAVEGKLGKLEMEFRPEVSVAFDPAAKTVLISRKADDRVSRAMHGLTWALIRNMFAGVTQGYEKKLEIVGVGYIAAVQQGVLQLRVGLANELQKPIPAGLTVTCPDQQHVLVKGIDKQLVSQFAAEVRALRKPEPYKGKGIRYDGEVVRRKQGKVMAK